MSVLEVLTYPDVRLKKRSEEVSQFDDDLRQFVADLQETMDGGPPSVGIAAPQVNRFQRIVIVDVSGMLAQAKQRKRRIKSSNNGRLCLVNPKITRAEGQVSGREGCLSVPDYTGNVLRASRITLFAQNTEGEAREYECSGFEARAVQHELDHLDGLLFLDRLVSSNELFRRQVYKLT
ncbi:MAG: peptide deformylase [Gammaproteobacteria bacterium]|nr:peptide deformylase [Gammaproteobacteria bacterium]